MRMAISVTSISSSHGNEDIDERCANTMEKSTVPFGRERDAVTVREQRDEAALLPRLLGS